MKAAVLYAPNQPLVIEDIELDEPQANEVLVKTSATGVCHSDLHFMEGKWMYPMPVVLGHESAGVVEKVGPGVTNVKAGDRVVIAFVQSCGVCDRCTTGRPNLCSNGQSLNRMGRVKLNGQPIMQFAGMSAFAEFQLVSSRACVKVPDAVPLEVAALVGCSVMTGVGAVTNTVKLQVGETVAVVGCGGVGLNVVQGARLAGARTIVAIDLLDNKLEYAKKFGATHTINAKEVKDVPKAVKAVTGGFGVDFSFDAIGSQITAQQCIEMCGPGGHATLVGIPSVQTTATFSPFMMVFTEKKITGSYYGSVRPSVDFPILADLAMQKRLDLDSLISRTYKFDEINDGFKNLAAGTVARGVILFD